MFKCLIIFVVFALWSHSAAQMDPMVGGILPLGLGGGIKHIGFGRLGRFRYGGIGGLKKGFIGGVPYSHLGGLYSKSLLLAPNPMESEPDNIEPDAEPGMMDFNGVNQQPLQDPLFEEPQSVGSHLFMGHADMPMARESNPGYQQPLNYESYGYNDQMLGDPMASPLMEDEQGRTFLRGNRKGHRKGYDAGSYEHEQKVYINLNHISKGGGYAQPQSYGYSHGYNKGYSRPTYSHQPSYGYNKGYSRPSTGYGRPSGYSQPSYGYRSAGQSCGFEGAQLAAAQPLYLEDQANLLGDTMQFQDQNQELKLLGDPMVQPQEIQTFQPQQQFQPNQGMQPLAIQRSEYAGVGAKEAEVGSPFFKFLGEPFMGIWNPESKVAQRLKHVDIKFKPSDGDNNYKDAPED